MYHEASTFKKLKLLLFATSPLTPICSVVLALPIQWIFFLLFIPPYNMENMEMKMVGYEPKVDLSYPVLGKLLSVDHGYALYGAISRVLPVIHEVESVLDRFIHTGLIACKRPNLEICYAAEERDNKWFTFGQRPLRKGNLVFPFSTIW